MDACEEVSGSFVVACCDSAVLLEFEEEVFYQVALFVEFFVVFTLDFAVGFRRDDGDFSCGGERLKNALIGIISFVSNDRLGCELWQERIRSLQIVGLSRR